MKRLYIIILLILTGLGGYGQQKFLKTNTIYKKSKIFLKPNKTIKAKNLIMSKDSFIGFHNKSTNKKEILPVEDIKMVSVKKGSHFFSYSIGGAVAGFGLALIATETLKSNPLREDFNYNAYIGGFTLTFAVIGGIIGSLYPKWESMFIDHLKLYSGNNLQINPQIDIHKDLKTIGLKINF